MRHRSAFTLVEILIAILIFIIGLIALGTTMLFSLKIIVGSWNTSILEQEKANLCETYMAKRTSDLYANTDVSQYGAVLVKNASISLGAGSSPRVINLGLYKFSTQNKKGSEIYVIQRINN